MQVALRPMRRLVNRLSARGAQNAERADVCLQVVSVSIVKELTPPTSLLRLERKSWFPLYLPRDSAAGRGRTLPPHRHLLIFAYGRQAILDGKGIKW